MNNNLDYTDLSNKRKEEIMNLFRTSEKGLNKNEASKRLEKYGEWL